MSQSIIQFAILDDHELVRKGIINIISSFSNFALKAEACDAPQLLSLMDRQNIPDICILGVNNSASNCYVALKELRAHWPEVKTLALSVFKTEDAIVQMLLRGVNGYALKSCSPGDLYKALMHLYYDGSYFPEIVTPEMKRLLRNAHDHWAFNFSERETEFMRLCTMDLTYKEIAERMLLSIKTVEHYRDTLFCKLKIKSRPGLVSYIYRNGLGQ